MDSQRFDAMTRRFGAGSRRQVLVALIAASVGQVIPGVERGDVAAACKGFGAKCSSGSPCCPGTGLTCSKQGKHGKRRCRCQQGWQYCSGADPGCRAVETDPDHCGDCGHQCPASKPCCVGGTCRPRCGDTCCADCFVEILLTGNPDLDHPVCCEASGGTICGPNKKKESDDRCCYPDQKCVKGECCCDGCEGAIKCGGRCCASAACCNGACCDEGQVCATTTNGPSCVSANRQCGQGNPPCLSGEVCHGGVCCAGNRVCGDGMGNDVCCGAGEYCEFPNSPIAECCPINTICKGTFRGHRVRR